MTAQLELEEQATLAGANQVLLDRLSGRDHPIMKDVWDRLRSVAGGREDLVVAWTCGCYAIITERPPPMPAYRPRSPKSAAEITEWCRKYAGKRSAGSAAFYASQLLDAMKQTSSDATDRWPELWRGDSQVTLEAAMSLIGHLEAFYRDLDSENKQLWAAVNFPEPRKRNAKRAPLACFARLLSHRFQRNFGKPCDEVIADLANVVFDTPDGRRMLGQRTVIAATIYALRRFATVG